MPSPVDEAGLNQPSAPTWVGAGPGLDLDAPQRARSSGRSASAGRPAAAPGLRAAPRGCREGQLSLPCRAGESQTLSLP